MDNFIKKHGISQSALKIIAVISMAIDHTGAVLFPHVLLLRKLGRLAFPIYCFLLIEGFMHTRSVKKYAIRLFIFALISEIPYDLAFHNTAFFWRNNNVFFTLLIGLISVWGIDYFLKKKKYYKLLAAFPAGLGILAAKLMCTDYNWYGVAIIYIFYLFRYAKELSIFPLTLLTLYRTGFFRGVHTAIQNLCIFAYIPIMLYNGEKGKLKLKYAFYAFYPVHLIVLYIIKLIIDLRTKFALPI